MANGTCVIASTISLNLNSIVWLYYSLIRHCLKRCVCFYQVAIPQEILNIVSMFVYIRYMFRYYFDLTNYQNCHHLYLRWLTPCFV